MASGSVEPSGDSLDPWSRSGTHARLGGRRPWPARSPARPGRQKITQSQSRGSGQQRSQIMKTHARQGGQARQATRKANAGAHLESPEPPRRASSPELLEPSERRQRPGSKLQAWTSHDPNQRPAPGTQQARGSYVPCGKPQAWSSDDQNRRTAAKTRQARGSYRFHAASSSHELHPRPAPKTRSRGALWRLSGPLEQVRHARASRRPATLAGQKPSQTRKAKTGQHKAKAGAQASSAARS